MFCNDTFIGTTWKWTKKWLQTWTVKNGYRQPEYLPPTPTSPCGLPGVRQRKTLACESPVYHRVMRVEKTWWLLIVLELSSWVDYSPFFSCMTRSWWDGARWRRGVPWVHNSAWGPKGLDFHPKERKKEKVRGGGGCMGISIPEDWKSPSTNPQKPEQKRDSIY